MTRLDEIESWLKDIPSNPVYVRTSYQRLRKAVVKDVPWLVGTLKSALLVIDDLKYGEGRCFCEVSIGNPNYRGECTYSCKQAMEFVKELNDPPR